MSKKHGAGKFILGAAIGAGLGLLFAPKKGSVTRAELKESFDNLLDQIKNIDKDDVKKEFDKKVESIKADLEDLDKEKALEIAKEKAGEVKDKVDELVELAVEKGTPVLKKTASDLRAKAIVVTKDVLKKLQKAQKDSEEEYFVL